MSAGCCRRGVWGCGARRLTRVLTESRDKLTKNPDSPNSPKWPPLFRRTHCCFQLPRAYGAGFRRSVYAPWRVGCWQWEGVESGLLTSSHESHPESLVLSLHNPMTAPSTAAPRTTYRPVVLMHGLGDAGSNPGMQSLAQSVMAKYPGSYAVRP